MSSKRSLLSLTKQNFAESISVQVDILASGDQIGDGFQIDFYQLVEAAVGGFEENLEQDILHALHFFIFHHFEQVVHGRGVDFLLRHIVFQSLVIHNVKIVLLRIRVGRGISLFVVGGKVPDISQDTLHLTKIYIFQAVFVLIKHRNEAIFDLIMRMFHAEGVDDFDQIIHTRLVAHVVLPFGVVVALSARDVREEVGKDFLAILIRKLDFVFLLKAGQLFFVINIEFTFS